MPGMLSLLSKCTLAAASLPRAACSSTPAAAGAHKHCRRPVRCQAANHTPTSVDDGNLAECQVEGPSSFDDRHCTLITATLLLRGR